MYALKTFITGQPGVGKTTCIKRVVQDLASRGVKVGGMITGEIREGPNRTGFQVENLLTGEVGVLASIGHHGPRVGKYGVNILDLDRIGTAGIEEASTEAQLIVIDEIGPMELCSEKFVSAVELALLPSKPILGTIHFRARHPLIQFMESRPTIRRITIDRSNRDLVAVELTKEFRAAIGV